MPQACFVLPPHVGGWSGFPASNPTDACASFSVAPQKVLAKAANLTASFQVLGGNVTSVFSWDLSAINSHQQLTGYQVTWAEVIPPTTNRHGNNNKLPHGLISQSQILPPVSKQQISDSPWMHQSTQTKAVLRNSPIMLCVTIKIIFQNTKKLHFFLHLASFQQLTCDLQSRDKNLQIYTWFAAFLQ